MSKMIATDEQLCEFIDGFHMSHGYPPTIREICARFGYNSPSTVKTRLDSMKRAGMVYFRPYTPRTIVTIDVAGQDDGVGKP